MTPFFLTNLTPVTNMLSEVLLTAGSKDLKSNLF
jgi:hypothetical protein